MYVLAKVLLCLLTASSLISYAKADNRGIDEATLRAAIILKIIHQVNWPYKIGDEINFCGSGGSKSYEKLLSLRGKVISREMARISFVEPFSEKCHVQILGPEKVSQPAVETSPLLVICDECGAERTRSAVELIRDQNHIRFNLNLTEAKRTNIKFKVSLLELAKTVIGRND